MNPCVRFDGTEDYLIGGDAAAISPTSAITMEAWVWPDTSATQVILTKGSAYRLLLRNSSTSACSLRAGVNSTFVTASELVPTKQWTHVAFAYTAAGESYQFYVNGEAAGSGTIAGAGTIEDNSDSLRIGGGSGIVDVKGYLDEVRISKYAKTEEDIRSFLYRSIDQSNEPNSSSINVVYNLDGTTMDNANDGGPYLRFRGDARFTSPLSNCEPEAPLCRAEELNFPGGFYIHTVNRVIPDGETMKPDSIYVSQDVALEDVNVFVAINHEDERDVKVSLDPPFGGAPILYNGNQFVWDGGHVISIFDNEADSTSGGEGSVTPRIRPVHALSFVGSARSVGWWKILVEDDTPNGVTGRLYAWGIQFNNQTVVGVSPEAGVPEAYALAQNYPNPFNPTTTIRFDLPKATHVVISVYNTLGQEVSRLVDEPRDAGRHEVVFDANRLASGLYFCTMRAGDFVATKKLTLLR